MLLLQASVFLTCKGDVVLKCVGSKGGGNAAYKMANMGYSALVLIQMLHLNDFNITEMIMLEIVFYIVKSDGFDCVIQLQ